MEVFFERHEEERLIEGTVHTIAYRLIWPVENFDLTEIVEWLFQNSVYQQLRYIGFDGTKDGWLLKIQTANKPRICETCGQRRHGGHGGHRESKAPRHHTDDAGGHRPVLQERETHDRG